MPACPLVELARTTLQFIPHPARLAPLAYLILLLVHWGEGYSERVEADGSTVPGAKRCIRPAARPHVAWARLGKVRRRATEGAAPALPDPAGQGGAGRGGVRRRSGSGRAAQPTTHRAAGDKMKKVRRPDRCSSGGSPGPRAVGLGSCSPNKGEGEANQLAANHETPVREIQRASTA